MSESGPTEDLRSFFRGTHDELEDHPDPEALVAYRKGDLKNDPEEAVRKHLLQCEECRGLLLDLADLESLPGRRASSPSAEVSRAWERLAPQLDSKPSRAREPPISIPASAARPNATWSGPLAWGLAACLAILSGLWGLELRKLKQERAAWIEGGLRQTIAQDIGQRGAGSELPLLALESRRPSLILLPLVGTDDGWSYRVEFLSMEGDILDLRTDLSASDGALIVAVTLDQLPEGVVRINVFDRRSDGQEPAGKYALQVRHR